MTAALPPIDISKLSLAGLFSRKIGLMQHISVPCCD